MDLSLGHTRTILDECERQRLLRNQAAYVLATAFWETARSMRPVVEAFWKSEDWRRRNLRYYPWHGRGFVQLTWEKNYQRAARELGIPFDQNPSLALDPLNAARVLVIGMREGWFTGKRLATTSPCSGQISSMRAGSSTGRNAPTTSPASPASTTRS